MMSWWSVGSVWRRDWSDVVSSQSSASSILTYSPCAMGSAVFMQEP